MTRSNDIAAALAKRLENRGFMARAPGIFTRPLCAGFLGWLGLNQAKNRRVIEVNPVIGVRCQAVEQALSTILDTRPNDYVPPTVSISLGYLMPDQRYHAWMFGGDTGDEVLSDLENSICRYGIPFLESSADLRSIDRLLQSPRFSHTGNTMYRRPITQWLMGDAEASLVTCDDYCRDLAGRVDGEAALYMLFARRFKSMLEQVDT